MHETSPMTTSVPRAEMRKIPDNMADRLIVALDVSTPEQARDLISKLEGIVSFYKIGLWLLFAEGTDKLIDDLVKSGESVFLDYKMFDIGETVFRGVLRAKDRGVKFITVHGDDEILQAAVNGRGDSDFLKIFTITVLTSMDDADLYGMGYRLGVKDLIELRVRKSIQYGCDGIIASASDNPNEIRQLVGHPGLLITTPGIRPLGFPTDDHKRPTNPTQAIRAGADYLVVGRPIVESPDPAQTARAIVEQMKLGMVGGEP
ncbi:MAG TPA: orotidine-5'-phosphate decarboxylase [Methylocella sp.]|nr:orotidine-5'-phosphate decarboxylase [Methylocella sp.]